MDIGRAFLEQDNQSGSSGADQIPPEHVHTCSEIQAKVNPTHGVGASHGEPDATSP
jgi:hypothetical protein